MDVMPDGQSSHRVKESSLVQAEPSPIRTLSGCVTWICLPQKATLRSIRPHAGTFGYALGLQCGESPKKIQNTKSVSQVNDYDLMNAWVLLWVATWIIHTNAVSQCIAGVDNQPSLATHHIPIVARMVGDNHRTVRTCQRRFQHINKHLIDPVIMEFRNNEVMDRTSAPFSCSRWMMSSGDDSRMSLVLGL